MKRTLSAKQKNGSVELLRFVFTSIVIFFHINLDLWDQKKVVAVIGEIPVTFFKHGNIGVEFFFIVTGWLLAKSVYSRYIRPMEEAQCGLCAVSGPSGPAGGAVCAGRSKSPARAGMTGENKQGLFAQTLQFTAHKVRAIFPYYILACALTPIVRLMIDRTVTVEYFLNRLPSLFLLQRIGIGKPFIGCTWYLSSMMLALLVVYPLCRRFYHAFTLFAAPLLCAVLLGAIIVLTGSLGDIEDWFFITYKTNIRAIAEISMGTTAFEISRRIQGRVHSAAVRLLLTATALTCLVLSVAYMCSAMDGTAGLAVFYLLFILVVIAFSGEGLLCHAGLFNHPVFAFLGKISLPMYVMQTLFRMMVPGFFAKTSQWTQCMLIYFGILGFSVFLHAVSSYMHRHPVSALRTASKRLIRHA